MPRQPISKEEHARRKLQSERDRASASDIAVRIKSLPTPPAQTDNSGGQPSRQKQTRRFGFSGFCLVLGLVTFAVQQGCSTTGNAPSWVWGTVWFLFATVLLLLSVWFWEKVARHHWIRKIFLSLLIAITMTACTYKLLVAQYQNEHKTPVTQKEEPLNQAHVATQTEGLSEQKIEEAVRRALPNRSMVVPSLKPSIFPFPWMGLMPGWMSLLVRDYPMKSEVANGPLGSSTLFNLQVDVTSPIAVNPSTDGWHACIVVSQHFQEWNNGNGTHPISSLPADKEVTLLEMRASARNGRWHSIAVLNLSGDYKESIFGTFVEDGNETRIGLMETCIRGERIIKVASAPIPLTRELLIEYGVPVVQLTKQDLDARCPNGSVFMGNIGNGKAQR